MSNSDVLQAPRAVEADGHTPVAVESQVEPRAATIWVIREYRYFTDLDGEPATTERLRPDLGYFTDQAALDATVDRLNAPLRAAHDQYNAQQHRDHAAAWKAYDRAMAERRVILDANLVPSSPEPVRPKPEPDEVSFAEYLDRVRARTSYTMFHGQAVDPAAGQG